MEANSRNPLFDPAWYLAEYPDVAAAGVEPLRHYLEVGAAEGRSPHPLFDAAWYRQRYEVEESGLSPLDHYLKVGWKAGYDPHPLFDTLWYLQTYPDVAEASINPLIDYLTIGAARGRDPSPNFDMTEYLQENPEAAASGTNPLVHYVKCGGLPPRDPRRRRVQIFRREGLGDVLLLTPVLKALRVKRPDDEIVVATAYPEMFEENPYVDHIIRARVPIEGCDETFLPEYETRPEEHIVESYARALGVSVTDRTPEIYLRTGERSAAAELLYVAGIRKYERFCVMQLTGGWVLKSWDPDRFKAVAEYLERNGIRVVVLGKDADPPIDFGVDLRGKASLRSVAAIIEKCALMVTIDSGLMHLGFAFRRPVISLFGCTDPAKIVPDWAMEAALHSDTVCRGCSHRAPAVPSKPVAQRPVPHCPWETVLCMERLSVDTVLTGVNRQLDRIAHPLVSIVVLYYNNQMVHDCLQSIFLHGAHCPFEIIVVANGSSDEYVSTLQTWLPNIRILRLEGRPTFAMGMNAGARASRGKYLLLLNDDTTVTAGWLDELLSFIESDPKIGIAGPKLLYPHNDLIQHCGTVVNENRLCEHIYRNMHRSFVSANRPRYFRALTGACLLIMRDLFFTLGGFDPAYINWGGCEDTDLCFKVVEHGKFVAYCPGSVIYHHEGISRGVRDERHPEDMHNRKILAERWSHYLVPDMSDYCLLAEIEAEEGRCWKRLADVPPELIARYDTPERRTVGRHPFRIQVMSGAVPEPGYLHLDAAASSPSIHIIHDPLSPLPFLDGSVGEIRADHFVERIPWCMLPAVMREFHRVLIAGGRLQILTTDLRAVAAYYLDGLRSRPAANAKRWSSDDFLSMMPAAEVNRHLFGEPQDRSDIRYSSMDGDSLVALCTSVGFAQARVEALGGGSPNHQITVTAVR